MTNPGDPAGAAGAVSGGPADREGLVPLRAEAPGVTAGCRRRTGRGQHGTAARHRPGRFRRPAPGGAPAAAGMAGTTDPHPDGPGSARSRFALSNWRVQWRLALLIAVPFLTAAVLGAAAIDGDVNDWQTTGRVQHLAQLNSAVVKYIADLEDERDYSVASTANRQGLVFLPG